MEGDDTTFQLTQARFRAVMATLSAVAIILVPVTGYVVASYLDKVDRSITATHNLRVEVAVMSNTLDEIKEDVGELNRAFRRYDSEPSVRKGVFTTMRGFDEIAKFPALGASTEGDI